MKIQDCKREIDERQYLIGMELQHSLDAHKIKIESLEPFEIANTGLYYIRCNYYKQDDKREYGTVLLANKLNDILVQYVAY